MNPSPPEFYGSKMEEDPKEFVDEVYKVLAIIGVNLVEKAQLAAYQLKSVAQVWYNQWKNNRSVGAGPIEWEVFKSAFSDRFFPQELRKSKVDESLTFVKED